MKLYSSKYYKFYAVLFLAAHLSFLAAGALHTHAYYHQDQKNRTEQKDPLTTASSECYFHFAASSYHQLSYGFKAHVVLAPSAEFVVNYENSFTLLTKEYSPFSFRAPPAASC